MLRLLAELFVSVFVVKPKRAAVKWTILSFPTKIRVLKRAKKVGKDFNCSGLYETRVTKNTTIGDHASINGLVIYGSGNVNIGNYVHMGAECAICSDNHNYEGDAIPYDDTVVKKDVIIGDYVWLGTRSLILPGTTIGEGAIIQAGSVVHGEIPPCAIAGGNPAKVFKYRDKEHFYKLKEEGKCY